MFVRVKNVGTYRYRQIAENRREGKRVKQTIIATLGRLDKLAASGAIDQLLRSAARFSEVDLAGMRLIDEIHLQLPKQPLGDASHLKAPPSCDDVPTQIITYERRAKVRDAAVADSGLRFGPEVPVQTIEVTDPAIEAIPKEEREVIGENVSYRLAQQPGSYVVLKYIRKVVKRLDTKTILTPPAPANVLERSAADVSFLAGMLVDKFADHLPLYRQHQRLRDAGIALSRSTLIHWTTRAIYLLAPITAAQSAHVLTSRVLAMDETSRKAGRETKGKMRTGWLWPVYGDADEVVFHYAPSRAHRHVHAFLGQFRGTLFTDGYEAYGAYAGQRPGEVTHVQCWPHTRRGSERANDSEPEAVAEALALIGAMYGQEKQLRADGFAGEDKRAYRQSHIRLSRPSNSLRGCGSRCSPTPPCIQTSVRTTTIRHHTERDHATTAYSARLRQFGVLAKTGTGWPSARSQSAPSPNAGFGGSVSIH